MSPVAGLGLPGLWLALALLVVAAFVLFDGVRSGTAVLLLLTDPRPSSAERALLVDGRSLRWLAVLGVLVVGVPGLVGRLAGRHGLVLAALAVAIVAREAARFALIAGRRLVDRRPVDGPGRHRRHSRDRDRIARLVLAATGVAVPGLVGLGLTHVALGIARPLSTPGVLAGGAVVAASLATAAATLAGRTAVDRRAAVRRAGTRAAGLVVWLAVVQVTYLLVVETWTRGPLASPLTTGVVATLVVAAAGYAIAARHARDGLALLAAGWLTATLLALLVKPVAPAADAAASAAVRVLATSPLPARWLTPVVLAGLALAATLALASYLALAFPRAGDDGRPRPRT